MSAVITRGVGDIGIDRQWLLRRGRDRAGSEAFVEVNPMPRRLGRGIRTGTVHDLDQVLLVIGRWNGGQQQAAFKGQNLRDGASTGGIRHDIQYRRNQLTPITCASEWPSRPFRARQSIPIR